MKGCKNCPAYAKCTVTYRESACAALRSTYGIDTDPEIITNADRIRAMSDEEMASEMNQHSTSAICDIVCHGECKAIATFDKTSAWVCNEIIMGWLQQPAEEEKR